MKEKIEKFKEKSLDFLAMIIENRYEIMRTILCILVGVVMFALAFWTLNIIIHGLLGIFFDNLIWIGFVAFLIFEGYHYLFNQRQERLDRKQERKRKELELKLGKIEQTAKNEYYYLKMFLFEVLDARLCSQLELFKPQTPELLQDLNPIQIENATGIVYYNFTIEKESDQPLSRGIERTKSILTSVFMNHVKLHGISGIIMPTGNDPRAVLYVHNVVDRGMDIQLTLVLDSEDYRNNMGNKEESQEQALIEHI